MVLGMTLLCTVLALLFEMVSAHRDHKIRTSVDQPLQGVEKERSRLYRLLFITSLLLLLFSLGLSASHRRWVTPVQGVAVVVDTTVTSGSDPSALLSIEKSVAKELIRSLPGITLSLYELREGAVDLVVPPTIDRIFFEIQLDGLQPSPHSASQPTLSEVQQNIIHRFHTLPPWVIVLTPFTMASGTSGLDSIANVVVTRQAVACTVMEMGIELKKNSLEKMTTAIVERFHLSAAPSPPDKTESGLLLLCTALALICFVLWRQAVAPLFVLGLALIASPHLSALSEIEGNTAVRQAIDIATAADYPASQQILESLLTTVAQPRARQRILFDRALLAYTQGKFEEAFRWLSMDPTILQGELQQKATTMQGLALAHLVTTSSDAAQEKERKLALEVWIAKKPPVGEAVMAFATSILYSPSMHDEEGVLRTLIWLEQASEETKGENRGQLTVEAAHLMDTIHADVDTQLRRTWPEEMANRFSTTTIGLMRLWIELAKAPTVENGISLLLDQASMSSNGALFFPALPPMPNLEAVLRDALPALPAQLQPRLELLLNIPQQDPLQRAAFCYARSVLWPVACQYDGHQIRPIALLLCQEIDRPIGTQAKEALGQLIASLCSIKSSTSIDEMLMNVLAIWYQQDPEEAVGPLIGLANQSPQAWDQRLIDLIAPAIELAKTTKVPLASAIAQGIGNELSSLDVSLTARLWQVSQTPTSNQQEVRRYVSHLVSLWTELGNRLFLDNDPVVHSFILIFSVQPDMVKQLSQANVFADNLDKRATYDQLLHDWDQSCLDVRQRIEDPATFRLERVVSEIRKEREILHNLEVLLKESEAPAAASVAKPSPSAPVQAPTSIRGEEAIRLFQEMDREDRALFASVRR